MHTILLENPGPKATINKENPMVLLNPSKKGGKKAASTKRPTAKQLAARKAFAEMAKARAGKSVTTKKAAPKAAKKAKKSHSVALGKHRPTLYKTNSGWVSPMTHTKGKAKSAMVAKGTRINPFNPKAILKKENLFVVGGGVAGYIVGMKVSELVRAKVSFIPSRWAGAVNVVAGIVLAVAAKHTAFKALGTGIAIHGGVDLATTNIPQISSFSIPGTAPAAEPAAGIDILDGEVLDGEVLDGEVLGNDVEDFLGEDDTDFLGMDVQDY